MIQKLRHWKYSFDPFYFKRSPFLQWCYAAYITIRYVDEWNVFPAIQFNGKVRLKIVKRPKAKIIIHKRLFLERWLHGNGLTSIILNDGATMEIQGDFTLGDGIKCLVDNGASWICKGRKNDSGSGITANSVVMVNKLLEIGYDCIVAWDTYITDCDWHKTGSGSTVSPTIIGDHVWIGVGVKILKGVNIGDNCIVGSNSVVVSGKYESQAFISGIPAKIVKQNIPDWGRDM